MEILKDNHNIEEQSDDRWNMDDILAEKAKEQVDSLKKKEYVGNSDIFLNEAEKKIVEVDFSEEIEDKGLKYTRYKLDDGTYYESVIDKKYLDNDYAIKACSFLKNKAEHFFLPRTPDEIMGFTDNVIESVAFYYNTSMARGKDDPVTKFSESLSKYWLNLSKDLSPLWWGKKSPKYPNFSYDDGNPYNMFGQDHKYDYLLSKDEKEQTLKKRELEMRLACGNTNIGSDEILVYQYGNLLDEERNKHN